MPTRVKICGITRPQDAALAAELGADAIGLNFFRGPRKLTSEIGALILREVPALVRPVGLIGVSEDINGSLLALSELTIGLAGENTGHRAAVLVTFQVYAPSSDAFEFFVNEESRCWSEFWWVANIANREAVLNLKRDLQGLEFPRPPAVLLDAHAPDRAGGTGLTFNWNWIAEARAAGELDGLPPIILAGGLTPDNVAEAIRIAKPYAVDVSSGVEVKGQPGIKDPIKLRDFIQAAKSVP